MGNETTTLPKLSAAQMASFVTDGYLVLDQIVPEEWNKKVYEEQQQYTGGGGYEYWTNSRYIQDVFQLPQVKGAVQSLVGDNPVYDHSFLHTVPARRAEAQAWHGDSIIDSRPLAFDIQIFYFAHDAPKETGPTLVLPGSHLRRINTFSISRYKNIVGQKQLAAKAGTMVLWHHGLWHCAMPNHTDRTRYVFKLRLRPDRPQRGLFDTTGCDSDEVNKILSRHFPWQGNEARLEHVLRAKLWRYVVGDDRIDVSFEGALTRMGL